MVILNEISKAKWFLFNLILLGFANRKGNRAVFRIHLEQTALALSIRQV